MPKSQRVNAHNAPRTNAAAVTIGPELSGCCPLDAKIASSRAQRSVVFVQIDRAHAHAGNRTVFAVLPELPLADAG